MPEDSEAGRPCDTERPFVAEGAALATFVDCSFGSYHNQVPNGGAERYSGDAYLGIAGF